MNQLDGDPCGIRTRDLQDENLMSWTARRRGQSFDSWMLTYQIISVHLESYVAIVSIAKEGINRDNIK